MKRILIGLMLALMGCTTSPQSVEQAGEVRKITVTNDQCWIDEQPVAMEDLPEHLNAGDQVLLMADKTVMHKRMLAIMDVCAKAGIKELKFSTLN